MFNCGCVSSLIPVIFIILGIYILYTKYMNKNEVEHFEHQLTTQNFQAQGCYNLKPINHQDCKCLRNNDGTIHGNNQCTRQINCVETVGQLSGPSTEYALKTFFKYDDGLNNIDYDNYELTEYRNILKEELENGKPVIYVGFSDEYGNGGHAWNIDGYDGDYFHNNWGWGGSQNGYYLLSALNGFNSSQGALVNI